MDRLVGHNGPRRELAGQDHWSWSAAAKAAARVQRSGMGQRQHWTKGVMCTVKAGIEKSTMNGKSTLKKNDFGFISKNEKKGDSKYKITQSRSNLN